MSIAREYEAFEPGSEAFQTLNPGLLRSFSTMRKEPVTDSGIRKFQHFQAGWQALLNNLEAKCSGRTKAAGYSSFLTSDSSLKDLTKTFNYLNVRRVVEFLQDALSDKAISENTKLVFFLESNGHSNGNSGHSSTAR